MTFIPFNFTEHGAWIKRLMNIVFSENTNGIVAVRDDGSPAGAVMFDMWTPNSVRAHLGAETPMVWRHGLHIETFKYVFETCDRLYLIGMTQGNNLKALKLNEHFGFKEVYRLKDGYAFGADYVFLQMNKEDCKYLENKDARRHAA